MAVPAPMLAYSALSPALVWAVTAITPLQLAGWPIESAASLPVDAMTALPAARTSLTAC